MNKLRILVVALVVILFAWYLVWKYVMYPMPKNWDKVKVGMTRLEVEKIVYGEEKMMNVINKGEMWSFLRNYSQGDLNHNKWRSEKAWSIGLIFDNGETYIKGNDKPQIEHFKDKVIDVEFYQNIEVYLQIIPFPWVYRRYHS